MGGVGASLLGGGSLSNDTPGFWLRWTWRLGILLLLGTGGWVYRVILLL